MFLLPFLNRDAFPNNTNQNPILRDCLTRPTGQPAFLLSIQLICHKVQLVLRNNPTMRNWLRNHVHCCLYCGHLRCLLLSFISLLLLLLGRPPRIRTVLLDTVRITTFDTWRGCPPCLFHGIGDKIFTRFFDFLGGIRIVGFRNGALGFRLRLLLLHMLSVNLLGSLQGFIGLLTLLCPTYPIYLVPELSRSIGLQTPFLFQGRSCIGDDKETHLKPGRDFI